MMNCNIYEFYNLNKYKNINKLTNKIKIVYLIFGSCLGD